MNNTEDFNYVKSKIQNEGFHYCFIHYSDFSEVVDEEFHILREAFIKSANQLELYVNKKAEEESEDFDEDFDEKLDEDFEKSCGF